MTTKRFSGTSDRMGRNPFASRVVPLKPAAAAKAAKPAGEPKRERRESALPEPELQSGLFQRIVIELPIRLVFVGLKTYSLLREVVREAAQGR